MPENIPPTKTREEETLVVDSSGTALVTPTFGDFSLKEDLLEGIRVYGFEKPSAIQQQVIPPVIRGHDVIVRAYAGSGKTSTISIAVLQSVDVTVSETQILILSPTREIVARAQSIISTLGENMGVRCYACIGGTSIREGVKNLGDGQHIVSGTPGRIFDMIRRQWLRTQNIKMLVLDETDDLLGKGFGDQIYEIHRCLPPATQVILLSATLPDDVSEVTAKLMADPVRILAKCDEPTLENVKQYFVAVEKEDWKFDTLCDLFGITTMQAAIFCNTRQKVDWLTEKLRALSYTVSSMYGDKVRKDRDVVMAEFLSGRLRILVTTDFGVRNIDAQQNLFVINYDLPVNCESYAPRVSRSGRFGRMGTAVNLATADDCHIIRDIEQFYGTRIEEIPVVATAII